jgi:hypothetical protein
MLEGPTIRATVRRSLVDRRHGDGQRTALRSFAYSSTSVHSKKPTTPTASPHRIRCFAPEKLEDLRDRRLRNASVHQAVLGIARLHKLAALTG